MERSFTRRNIVLYKNFVLFNEPLFWGPILIITLNTLACMPLSDIYFMESAVMALCVVLDISFGSLADLIGRKKTLIIGRVFLLGSIIGFAFMSSPLDAWISNILWAIGFSFQSGADVSLLYGTLKKRNVERMFKKIEGAAVGSRLLLMACCSLVVGPLAEINLRIPLLLCIPFSAIPLVLSFFFREPVDTQKYAPRAQFRIIKEGISFVFRKCEVRWIIGFTILLSGASKIWFFTYNPYFQIVGVELKYFGVVFFLLNVVAWFSSRYAYLIERRLSERTCVIGMLLCVGVPILLMGLIPCWLSICLVFFQNIVRGFLAPFKGDFLNKHIASEHIRTTVLSVQSSVGEVVAIVTLAWFGFMMEWLTLLNSLVVLGTLVLVFGALSYQSYTKIPP